MFFPIQPYNLLDFGHRAAAIKRNPRRDPARQRRKRKTHESR
jgi:hypothetical protein